MLRQCLQTLRWCASLGHKFTIVVPGATLTVVFATLISQLGMMLAMFLPLKIVILLGSDRIPRYFPASFAEIDRDFLIGALSAATVIAFVVHLLAERIVAFSADRGAGRLLERSQKLVLFENQDEVAVGAYRKYAGALAGGVFAALVILLLVFVYPTMAAVIGIYLLVTVVGIFVAGSASSAVRERLAEKLQAVTSMVGNVGFLVVFAWLVIDFLLLSPPGLLVAIVSLLLSRLALTRLSALVVDVAGLERQRIKLDALFFHGKVFLADNGTEGRSIWTLLPAERRSQWIDQLLDEFVPEFGGQEQAPIIRWQETLAPGVMAFTVHTTNSPRSVLVKLFDRNKRSVARHEAELMGNALPGLPAPEWIGATQVEEFHCHLFWLPSNLDVPVGSDARAAMRMAAGCLMAVEPPARLVQRYARSRPQLWQRLDAAWFERLAVAASGKDSGRVSFLAASIDRMREHLKNLPAAIMSPDQMPGHLLVDEKNAPVLLNWGRWALEPLGSGWLAGLKDLEGLDEALVRARSERVELADVADAAVSLAALLHALEQLINRQRLTKALALVPQIIECVERLDDDAQVPKAKQCP